MGQAENNETIEVWYNIDSSEEQYQNNCQTCDVGLKSGMYGPEIQSDGEIAENIQILKGTLMQIWKSVNIFIFI